MRRSAAIGVALACSYPAAAQDTTPLAAEAAIAPIALEAVYTAEIWRNQGGLADGWRYLDNFDLTLSADLDRAAGVPDTRAFAYVLYNNGASLGELTGDALVASNIETGVRALRLYEAWIEHDFDADASLRVGLYDLNSEFDALDTSALFIGSAHGIGVDVAQSGANGPSIFPVTSLAARLHLDLAEGLALRTAVLDAVPGDPDRPARTAIILGDGALAIAEADWRIGGARLLVGAWGYSKDQPRIDGAGHSPSRGAYLRGEACLPFTGECSVRGFFRLGAASQATNPFDRFASAGMAAELTPDALLGLAVAHADGGRSIRQDPAAPHRETSYEATLAWSVAPQLSLQPNLQLVSTQTASARRDATVIGLRIVVSPFAR